MENDLQSQSYSEFVKAHNLLLYNFNKSEQVNNIIQSVHKTESYLPKQSWATYFFESGFLDAVAKYLNSNSELTCENVSKNLQSKTSLEKAEVEFYQRWATLLILNSFFGGDQKQQPWCSTEEKKQKYLEDVCHVYSALMHISVEQTPKNKFLTAFLGSIYKIFAQPTALVAYFKNCDISFPLPLGATSFNKQILCFDGRDYKYGSKQEGYYAESYTEQKKKYSSHYNEQKLRQYSQFTRAIITDCTFTEVDLSNSCFYKTNLSNSIFDKYTKLDDANFNDANLAGTNYAATNYHKLRLWSAKITSKTKFNSDHIANLKKYNWELFEKHLKTLKEFKQIINLFDTLFTPLADDTSNHWNNIFCVEQRTTFSKDTLFSPGTKTSQKVFGLFKEKLLSFVEQDDKLDSVQIKCLVILSLQESTDKKNLDLPYSKKIIELWDKKLYEEIAANQIPTEGKFGAYCNLLEAKDRLQTVCIEQIKSKQDYNELLNFFNQLFKPLDKFLAFKHFFCIARERSKKANQFVFDPKTETSVQICQEFKRVLLDKLVDLPSVGIEETDEGNMVELGEGKLSFIQINILIELDKIKLGLISSNIDTKFSNLLIEKGVMFKQEKRSQVKSQFN